MNALLRLSRAIDALNERVGRGVMWLALVMVLIGAYNAIVRAINPQLSSNTWIELQWYLFSAVLLLMAGYTMLHNGHVRVDVVYSRMNDRQKAWVDLLGALVFVIPLYIVLLWLALPFINNAFPWSNTQCPWQPSYLFGIPADLQGVCRWEVSNDPGGLIRWPVKILIIPGFILLMLQAFSEAVKNFAYLRGVLPSPSHRVEGEIG